MTVVPIRPMNPATGTSAYQPVNLPFGIPPPPDVEPDVHAPDADLVNILSIFGLGIFFVLGFTAGFASAIGLLITR